MQRPISRGRQIHKMLRVPADATSVSCARRKLERHVCNFGSRADKILPSSPITIRAGVYMERGRQPFADELFKDEGNTFNTVQIVPPGAICKKAEIWRCDERHPERSES